jgi:hypothetical protein
MAISRRSYVVGSGSVAMLAAGGSMARAIGSASPALARSSERWFAGYGPLHPDPAGLIALPAGFHYRVFSRQGDPLTRGGVVPASHDGMAAFASVLGTWLVRNHELSREDVDEDGLVPVFPVPGIT